jgi:hypothetical protein
MTSSFVWQSSNVNSLTIFVIQFIIYCLSEFLVSSVLFTFNTPWENSRKMVRQLQPWVAIVALPFVLLLCYIMVYVTQKTDIEGRPTYEYAGFRYESHARFDNTWPTYSTDYVITFVLLIQGFMISKLKLEDAYKPLQKLILQLLALYGGSTLVGGIAHHMYDGRVSSLNTNEFYLMWITVLGCTAVAGGCQGLIGT